MNRKDQSASSVSAQLIFIYDHFYPDFTAGGPITSLANLSNLIASNIPVRIITSAYQYQNHEIIPDVQKNEWTTWNDLPVWYATSKQSFRKALSGFRPEETTLYLNGIFSINYFLTPLRIGFGRTYKIVISPRGMLQSGALKSGYVKKRVFINFLRLSGLIKNVHWHATDVQEAEDISTIIQTKNPITIIPNVPVIRKVNEHGLDKHQGELRLVYYSLISEKKNLLFLIEILSREELRAVSLNIIGPIKDKDYWVKCLERINALNLNERIKYDGEVSPEKGLSLLSSFHALALPTHGENFGHAIVEMLSASRPVIISDKTPWNDLNQTGAGFSIPLEENEWSDALMKMIDWDNDAFRKACNSAFDYYQSKFDFELLKKKYLKLFNMKVDDKN